MGYSWAGMCETHTESAVFGRTQHHDGADSVQLLVELSRNVSFRRGNYEEIPVPAGTANNPNTVRISIPQVNLNSASPESDFAWPFTLVVIVELIGIGSPA